MRKFPLLILLFIGLIGCSNETDVKPRPTQDPTISNETNAADEQPKGQNHSQESDISGAILNVEEDRILITSLLSDSSLTACHVTFPEEKASEFEIGQRVTVWFLDGTVDTYPGQAALGDYELDPVDQPDGASMTEADVIKEAVKDIPNRNMFHVSIPEFHPDLNEWTVDVYDQDSDQTETVVIEE